MAEQQQQLHEPVMILNTVLKLKAIAQLDDLKDYGEALRWVVDLPNSTMALLRKKTEVSQDICSQLLGSYCTAISTGLKHLHLNWPQPFVIDTRQNSNAMFAVRTVSTLAYSPGLWREPSLSQYCSEFTCQVPDMAIKAGKSSSDALHATTQTAATTSTSQLAARNTYLRSTYTLSPQVSRLSWHFSAASCDRAVPVINQLSALVVACQSLDSLTTCYSRGVLCILHSTPLQDSSGMRPR